MAPSTRNRRRAKSGIAKPREKAAPYVRPPAIAEPPRKPPGPFEDIRDVLNFYDRSLIPKEKVCPFSAPSRSNPCTVHAIPRKRKDIIQNHLLHVKFEGYDDQHPANDPLWDSWEVTKYWLASRPPPITSEEDKKAARSKAAKKSYQSRLEREEREAGIRKRQYEEGQIPFSEYKRVLVGHKRRKAELEYRLGQIRGAQGDLEREVAELEAKLASITSQSTAGQQRIDDLDASPQSVKQSKERLLMSTNELVNMSKEVVRCWGQSEELNMESSGESFMTDIAFPTECSITAFYRYAALLHPPTHSNDLPIEGTHIQNMKQALQAYAEDLQHEIGPDDDDANGQMQDIDDFVANFNACCELVDDDRKKATDLGAWIDVQKKLWTDAKAQRKRWLDSMLGLRAPIQTARIYDRFVSVVRKLTRETETDAQISFAAQDVSERENAEESSAGVAGAE